MARIFSLTDLIDLQVLRRLAESLWRSSALPTKLIDPQGRVLVSAGNQDLCFLFHRRHPVSLQRCIESDTDVDELLRNSAGTGPPLETRCRNGLNHIGFPITIAGQHLATLFLSQFLYDPPEENVFLGHARELGLDEEKYLSALRKVPILDRPRVQAVVPFYEALVVLLTEMGEREARLIESRDRLQQSEEKFRTLFEGANDAMLILAPDGRILDCNTTAAEKLAYSRSELQGMHVSEIDHSSCATQTGNGLTTLLEDGQVVFETTHRSKNGAQLPVEINARRMEIEGETVVLAAARDLTERKRVEQALRESEERFRSIIESTPLGVLLYQLDADGRLIFSDFNPAAERILAIPLADYRGKQMEEIFPPLAATEIPERYRAICRGDKGDFREAPYNYGGISGTYEVHAFSTGFGRMAVLFADISERKQREKELLYRERFETLVARISTRFMEEGSAGIDTAIHQALADMGKFVGVDRCYLFQFTESGEHLTNTHEWCAADVSCQKEHLQAVPVREVPWIVTRILAGEVVHIPNIAELPREAHREREHLAAQAIRSVLAVPVVAAGRITGLLGFDAVHSEKAWDERDITLLRTVGELIGSALERRRAEQMLDYRACLEQLIAEISARMVKLEPETVDEAIDDALRKIGTFVGVDRCYVFQFAAEGETMANTHEWCARGIESFKNELRELSSEELPWFIDRIRRLEPVYVPHVTALGPEAHAEQVEWRREGIESLLCVPMVFENRLLGFIGFDAVGQAKCWPEEIILLLRVVGECFANALERRHSDHARRERERALRESRERLALAQRLALTGTWEWEIAGDRVIWSEETFDIVHMNRSRFDGTLPPFWQMICPEDLPAVEAAIRDCLEKGAPFRMDYRVRGDDGGTYWMASAGNAIRNAEGIATGMSGLIQDITERKEAETALRNLLRETEEARTRMAAILRCMPIGVLLANTAERIVLVNTPARELLQLPAEQDLPCPLAEMPFVPALTEQIRAVLVDGQAAGPTEWEISDNQGQRRTIQVRSDPVSDAEGHVTGAITLLQDITREREIDRMKSEFISTAAHELRTPLASVMGYSELLLNQAYFGNFSAEEQRSFLEEINARAEDLAEIVDDLLNLSRVESGQTVRLKPAFENLGAVLRDAVDDFVRLHPEYRFDLHLPALPGVFIDAGKIRQVLENLLGNAVKFSPKGTTVRVVGHQVGNAVEIRLQDEGIGMTAEQLTHVFDKFYRGDASNTAVGGLGLGMAIVKNIIEAHGGTVRVESSPGKGTTVRFILPLVSQP